MMNEIVGFGGLNFIFQPYVFSDLTIKCVLGLGRLVRILDDPWKWYMVGEGIMIFNVEPK
jgi:hypothetical protein